MTRGCWLILALLLLVGLAGLTESARAAGCAETPAAALVADRVANRVANQGTTSSEETRGFRVERVRWDALLRQGWAVVGSCGHPERPKLTLRTALSAPQGVADGVQAVALVRSETALPMVRAGDLVRLWRSDGLAHLEMVATVEQNGAVGARVRLRLMMPKDADGQAAPPRYLAGVVRGPADVEMVP